MYNLDGIPADEFRIIQEEHENFKKSLGDLTLNWADLESAIRSVLRHYAGVSTPVARALFSGTRARVAMDMIESIANNTNLDAERANDLNEVFSVVRSLNTMRDFLVHHVDGSMIESSDDNPRLRKLSNFDSVSRPTKGKTFWISSSVVHDMCHDMTECCWRLLAHRDSTEPFQRGLGPSGAPAPWRYKPPQPVRDGR